MLTTAGAVKANVHGDEWRIQSQTARGCEAQLASFWFWTMVPDQTTCSYEREGLLLRLWARMSRKLTRKPQQMELNLWTRRLKRWKLPWKAIRNMALNALHQKEQSQEQCSMRWKCRGCRYIKHLRGLLRWNRRADVPGV